MTAVRHLPCWHTVEVCPRSLPAPDLSTSVTAVDSASLEVRSSTGFEAGTNPSGMPAPVVPDVAALGRSAHDAAPGSPAGPDLSHGEGGTNVP